MRKKAEAFDHWIRTSFVAINTELENLYFAQQDRARVLGVGDPLKERLRDEGRTHIVGLLAEGNTGDGFASAFGVLGNVGLYLGALSAGTSSPTRRGRNARPFPKLPRSPCTWAHRLGMVPRFATAHLTTHNMALAGIRKSFTSLADEFLFIDENTRGILAFQRAADALMRIVPLGISSPVNDVLFDAAKRALGDAIRATIKLFSKLDVDRFFFSVRPYYKPYRIGRQEYRGANAGDFSGINEIDLLLGCVVPTIRTTHNSWWTRCCSCCRRTRRACASA
jgi:hypothetical protein